ncbi:oxophytodienoate reductase-like protein [Seminavis robusta]|uniref:Oxophytodienoate reductase-like protein n=1 Tax=Seminavis robusta TaxID=568900 RepID=A0A9N8DMW7_9STRA|nr:oxophytodienoate reductase-like protein [Seminavis robusta]|eukprot:Sro250_g098890.1 oxophytodienoate reductase-like protein (398) ;mRNA; r:8263-9456
MELLTKVTVGGQELKNRLVLAPLTRARCENTVDPFDKMNSMPNDIMADYYAQRASGGLIVTEATAISEDGAGWRNAPHIRTKEQAQAWKKIVDRVHENDGLIYLQLWHMGRQSHSSHHPNTKRVVSAGNLPIADGSTKVKTVNSENADPEVPHALTIEEIKETIQDYVNASKLAQEAGFDGVEVHAANGYLIDQFLQSSSNNRTDEYGGSKENRVRFLQEVVQAIIDSGAFPANRIGFRISPNGVFGGMGSKDNYETFTHVAKTMNEFGLAYLHIMDGKGFGWHGLDRAVTAFDVKKVFDAPIISNVGLTKESAEGMIRSGAADLACFGRLFMSNPDLPERFANDWPTAPPAEYPTWWGPTGAKGYTDFPTYEEVQMSKSKEIKVVVSEDGVKEVET